MRVTLNQDELFGAITEHLRDKLNLDNTAKIEISFTAGRTPKGYTADVEITYPKSPLADKCSAGAHDTDVAEVGHLTMLDPTAASADTTVSTVAVPDPTAGGAVSPDNLFGTN